MNTQKIAGLLEDLQLQLRNRGENNWIRGVTAVREALDHPSGVERARSMYVSLFEGINSFADYNVWHDDFATRRALNAEIDRLRTELWNEFKL